MPLIMDSAPMLIFLNILPSREDLISKLNGSTCLVCSTKQNASINTILKSKIVFISYGEEYLENVKHVFGFLSRGYTVRIYHLLEHL